VLECLGDNSGVDKSITSLLAITGEKKRPDEVLLYVQETSMSPFQVRGIEKYLLSLGSASEKAFRATGTLLHREISTSGATSLALRATRSETSLPRYELWKSDGRVGFIRVPGLLQLQVRSI
jgi:hypothetical protein